MRNILLLCRVVVDRLPFATKIFNNAIVVLKFMRGPCRPFQRKSSFSTRVDKYWTGSPFLLQPPMPLISGSGNLIWRGNNCLLKSRHFPSFCSSSPPSPQLRNPRLHYPHLCYPNPLFTVIHNRIYVKIFRYRITLPICGYLYITERVERH